MRLNGDKVAIPADIYERLKTSYTTERKSNGIFTTADKSLLRYYLEGQLRRGEISLSDIGVQTPPQARQSRQEARRTRLYFPAAKTTAERLESLATDCGMTSPDMFAQIGAALAGNSPTVFYSTLATLQESKRKA